MAASRRPPRIDAMLEQLDETSENYIEARDEFDAARVNYEVAREKFASVRRIALEVLSHEDWLHWIAGNSRVQYTGVKIGDAILEALDLRAFVAARDHFENKVPFEPGMTLQELQEAIERGGFEFRSTMPLREVNAALINLDRTRIAKKGVRFRLARAEKYLEQLRPVDWEAVSGGPTELDLKPGPDDVPF